MARSCCSLIGGAKRLHQTVETATSGSVQHGLTGTEQANAARSIRSEQAAARGFIAREVWSDANDQLHRDSFHNARRSLGRYYLDQAEVRSIKKVAIFRLGAFLATRHHKHSHVQ
jgi:hypothetical protein